MEGEMAARKRKPVTRVERLVADRDNLESAIEGASASALPALVREHRMVLAEIDKLSGPAKGSTRDQLAAKRAARAAGTARPAAPKVR